jgi:hypothetical protein
MIFLSGTLSLIKVPYSLGGRVRSPKKISAIFGFSIAENLVYTPLSKSESTSPYKRRNRAAVLCSRFRAKMVVF